MGDWFCQSAFRISYTRSHFHDYGSRAMTRYEFVAGLNACLDRVNELIATATTDLVKKEYRK